MQSTVSATDNSKSVNAILSVRNLSIGLPKGMDRQFAVRDISFELRAGEILCIIGESGSGKSVTANTIMGLLPSTMQISGGEIDFRGRTSSKCLSVSAGFCVEDLYRSYFKILCRPSTH